MEHLAKPIEHFLPVARRMGRELAKTQTRRKRHALPAVLMRSGTSKGLFLHREDLPEDITQWETPLLAAMGSKNCDPRQIDGVGGATSTTSKVAVVSPSQMPGVDVEYTFAQVAVGNEKVDFSGNCGNIASGVGAFALQEGLIQPPQGQSRVRMICAMRGDIELSREKMTD